MELQQLVRTRLQSDSNVGALNIEVTAHAAQNAVELKGVAYTQLQRTSAVRLAGAARVGITVQDKIDVTPYAIPRDLFDDTMMKDVKADAQAMGDELGNTLDDGWLHMKVVSKLLADTKTSKRNINVDVTNSVVTLRGSVSTQASLEQCEQSARSVSGVTDVKNHLVVKP